jgi:prepilin signal peptidase PulO-like enzyme (type II secretory pathway)
MDLLPNPVLSAVLAALGGLAAVVLVRYAARRTLAQPVALALADEVRVLVGVLAAPERLPYLTALAPSDFAAAANGRIWDALLRVCAGDLAGLGEDPSDEDCAQVAQVIADRGVDLHAALQKELAASPTAAADLRRLAYLAAVSASDLPTDEQVADAAAAVLQTGTDRTRLSGAAPLVPSLDPDSVDPSRPPVVRFAVRPSRVRVVMSAAAMVATGALLPAFVAAAGLSGAAGWVALAALAALAAGCLVISLVDLDTMYVDLRAFLVTAVGSWALTIAAVGLAGQWSRLPAGVVMVAATGVVLELVNRVHRKVRGYDGQGFGDTLILLATVGVPAALVGEVLVGLWSLLAAYAAGLVGWVVQRLMGRVDTGTPFAFGPYLAAGWVLAWVAMTVGGAQW